MRIRDTETGESIELEHHDSLGYVCRACRTDECRHTEAAYRKDEGYTCDDPMSAAVGYYPTCPACDEELD